jgi:hypothetical protein
MPEYDNPASRLHALMLRYRQRGSSNTSTILDSWSHALDVAPDQVMRCLADVADLVEETRKACEDAQQAMFVDLPGYLESLTPVIYPMTHAIASAAASNAMPSELALKGILDFSRWLHQYIPEPKVPDDDDVSKLLDQVRELITAIVGADDLDPGVKRLLLQHLEQVLEALEHLRFRGGDAVKLASLALIGVTWMADGALTKKQHALTERVRAVALKACVIFAAVAPMGSNLVGWDQAFRGQLQLPAPVVQAAHAVQEPQSQHLAKDAPPDGNAEAAAGP